MNVRQVMLLAAGWVLTSYLVGCSNILGIGDLPPATDADAAICNPASASGDCQACIASSCCDSLQICANDSNCLGALSCNTDNSITTNAGLCECFSSYGGVTTLVNAPVFTCAANSCGGPCGTGATANGAACSDPSGCLFGPCVQDGNAGAGLCFQFCCSDSDCPPGSTCNLSAIDIAGNPTQYCN